MMYTQKPRHHAQNAHFHMCFLAYVVLERARIENNQTSYKIRRSFRFRPELVDNLFTKLNFQDA